MKRIFIAAAAMLCFAACSAQKIDVTVKNPIATERTLETVEIVWGEIKAKLGTVTPENVIVLDAAKKQIPSQVIFVDETVPHTLIFQATVSASDSVTYTITTGTKDEYPAQAFGRFVPERLDDYAWENNMVAYRTYGPALKNPVAPGIDVWTKCTDKLIINEWYAKGDYHHNYGEGMDCYKVGPTLGGGSCAPLIDGKLWFSGNYATQTNLENGPIRTTVKLTYEPYKVGEYIVSQVKTICLDANTYFSKMENVFTGDVDVLPVAAGMIMHTVKDTTIAEEYVAITEQASDSKQPEIDGDISIAAIMPGAISSTQVDGHLLIVGEALKDIPIIYWTGAGWSGAKVKDSQTWKAIVSNELQKIKNPLKVTLK